MGRAWGPLLDMDFPEQLLGSSLLVPLSQASAPEAGGRAGSPHIEVPPPPPAKRLAALPPAGSAAPSTARSLSPHPDADGASVCGHAWAFGSPKMGRPQWESSLKTVRLELEKEKELFKMHSEAASKSLDRIGSLAHQLSRLIEEAAHESPPKIQDVLSPPSCASTRSLALRAPSPPAPPSNSSAHPNASLNVVSASSFGSIVHVSATVKSRYFPRKPRCLAFAGEGSRDLMITSSLDGSIQYTSMSNQAVVRSVFIPSVMQKACYAETICPAPRLGGFVVSTMDAHSTSGSDELSSSPSSLLFLKFDVAEEGSPVALCPPGGSPHQKSIGATCPLLDGSARASFRFLTGGADKNVALWELDESSQVKSVVEIHRSHTAAIQALGHASHAQDVIWSGGADCRLVGWSLKEGRKALNHRFSSRLSHILSHDSHPHLLMLSFSSATNQLQLFDCRASSTQRILALFGHQETSPTSRYLKPGWSPAGNLVALGTASPASRVSAINIWDIRYLDSGEAVKSLEFAGEKRFLSCEFWPAGNTIVALATDNSANFIEFTTC